MTKYLLDLKVKQADRLNSRYTLLRLTSIEPLPLMQPGQFAEVRVDDSHTFLRRPISICNYLPTANELWLLVAAVGHGTRWLTSLSVGDSVNCLLPLGNGFFLPHTPSRLLLVGGGVGVAPLLYYGRALRENGSEPVFLLGARSKSDLLLIDEFEAVGRVLTTTEDGTHGTRGFVTDHSVFGSEHFDAVATCGPLPMMKAVAVKANEIGADCEASLENLMACGLGACLCCVEKVKPACPDDTDVHNVCVCKEGPVFNTKRLLWQI